MRLSHTIASLIAPLLIATTPAIAEESPPLTDPVIREETTYARCDSMGEGSIRWYLLKYLDDNSEFNRDEKAAGVLARQAQRVLEGHVKAMMEPGSKITGIDEFGSGLYFDGGNEHPQNAFYSKFFDVEVADLAGEVTTGKYRVEFRYIRASGVVESKVKRENPGGNL